MTIRLNPTDEMLYGAQRSLGSSRIVQVLWRLPAAVSSAALRDEWHRLDRGTLSRQAASARFPGARRKWVEASNAEPPHDYPEPLDDAGMADWIDEQVRAPLPAGSPALWRLAAARRDDGSGLVSLTVPHFRSDGLGVFAELGARGEVRPEACSPIAEVGGDLADALGQVGRALRQGARWAGRMPIDRQGRARLLSALRAGLTPAAGSAPRFFASTILEVDAASWRAQAAAYGGTTNSLFMEIAANLIRARFPVRDRLGVRVGVPMSLRRSAQDRRANALIVVPVDLAPGSPQHKDLRLARRAAKVALAQADESGATLVPEPLWHLLPRRYANRLKTPGAQQTDVVASNFGEVPDSVATFAGQRAASLAVRTMNVPGVVPEKARLRASLCLLEVAGRMVVTATGMPDDFGAAESLRALVADELAGWGLRACPWGAS